MQEAGVSVDGVSTSLLARLGQDGPLPLTTLAERMHLDLSFVSRKARGLERHGLVRRYADALQSHHLLDRSPLD